MKRTRYTLPLTIGGVALLVALGATVYDRLAPTAQAAKGGPLPGGILDPHTGKRLTFDPRLAHTTNKPLAAGDKVKLGEHVPAFSFTDFEGKPHRMADYKGKVAIFTFVFAACPCTRAYNDRMKAMVQQYGPQGVELVYLFADPGESMSTIQSFAKRQGYTWTLARDTGQPLTKLFDAHCSTESYVIDREGVLRYHGRIDDEIFAPENVKDPSLQLAIKSVLADQPVAHPERPVFACSIPRGA